MSHAVPVNNFDAKKSRKKSIIDSFFPLNWGLVVQILLAWWEINLKLTDKDSSDTVKHIALKANEFIFYL
jgi:hypothetical protein